MLTGLVCLLGGIALIWLSVVGFRRGPDGDDRISAIEYVILKTTGSEPLPLTKFDHFLTRAQLWLGMIFGIFFATLGVIVLTV